MTWHFVIGRSMHELWADEVWIFKLHLSIIAICSVRGQVQDIFGKRLRASTRWCIHLRSKIEIYGGENVKWYKIIFSWRRASEIQGHGVIGLLHGILEWRGTLWLDGPCFSLGQMKFENPNFIHHLLLYLMFDGQVQAIFEKHLRASTRWDIHLRLKIKIYGGQNEWFCSLEDQN